MSKRLIHKVGSLNRIAKTSILGSLPKPQLKELQELRDEFNKGLLTDASGVQPSLISLHKLVCQEFKVKCCFSAFRNWMRSCD